jgi:hypothetical protein
MVQDIVVESNPGSFIVSPLATRLRHPVAGPAIRHDGRDSSEDEPAPFGALPTVPSEGNSSSVAMRRRKQDTKRTVH